MKIREDLQKFNTLSHFKVWSKFVIGKRIIWAQLNSHNIPQLYADPIISIEYKKISHNRIYFNINGDNYNYYFIEPGNNFSFWHIKDYGFYYPNIDPIKFTKEEDYYKWLADRSK